MSAKGSGEGSVDSEWGRVSSSQTMERVGGAREGQGEMMFQGRSFQGDQPDQASMGAFRGTVFRKSKSLKGRLSRVIQGNPLVGWAQSIENRVAKQKGFRLAVINFHRIAPRFAASWTPAFDPTLFSVTEDQFEQHVLALLREAEPISEMDLLRGIYEDVPLPRKCFLLTFDDGYRDNFERAAPILERWRVPGVFFVPTQAICERKLGWWDHIYWVINQCRKSTIEFRGERFVLETEDQGRAMGNRHQVVEQLLEMMKRRPAQETCGLLSELQSCCDVKPVDPAWEDAELMTWDQLRQLDRHPLFRIGSHTHSHRVLATLSPTIQAQEMMVSKSILEEKLGRTVDSLAYPVGGYEHILTDTFREAQSAGYRLGFSFLTGMNRSMGMMRHQPFDIRRIDHPVEPDVYGGIFSLPQVFAQRSCQMKYPRSWSSFEGA